MKKSFKISTAFIAATMLICFAFATVSAVCAEPVNPSYVDYSSASLLGFKNPVNEPLDDHSGTTLTLPALSGKYEKMNFPIVGLTPGKRYTLTFDAAVNKSLSRDYWMGFRIADQMETGLTKETAIALSNKSGYRAWTDNGTSTVRFKATAETMYVTWECSNMVDNTTYIMTFSNTAVNEVYIDPESPIPQDIEFDPAGLEVSLGEKKPLVFSFVPAGSTSEATFSSANKSIATVDENGIVSGIKSGTTIITVIDDYENVAEIPVTVVPYYLNHTPIACAHRGASGYKKDNSIAAFECAGE